MASQLAVCCNNLLPQKRLHPANTQNSASDEITKTRITASNNQSHDRSHLNTDASR
ncbi:hypothetical protein ABVT39_027146 [Epinephelus coioides]